MYEKYTPGELWRYLDGPPNPQPDVPEPALEVQPVIQMQVASGAPPPVHAQDLLVWNSDSSSSSSSESEPDLVKELLYLLAFIHQKNRQLCRLLIYDTFFI